MSTGFMDAASLGKKVCSSLMLANTWSIPSEDKAVCHFHTSFLDMNSEHTLLLSKN